MGFWSDIFKKRNNSTLEQKDECERKETSENLEEKMEFDSDGWLRYPGGLKLKIIEKGAYMNHDYDDIITSLGYKTGELYIQLYNDNQSKNVVFTDDSDVMAFSELFTDKLIFLLRHDGKAMTIKDKDRLIAKMRSNQYSIWGLKRIGLLSDIANGIIEQTISRQFVERVFNCTCTADTLGEDKILDVEKFHFVFFNDLLCDCEFDGYSVFMFTPFKDISFGEIDDYFRFANKTCRIDSTMKKIINYQSRCADIIDSDIKQSEISRRKFAYDYENDCINYIAMAAHYKQCDVEQELFILSTDGQYEIISKENHNGVTTTKIRAYHEIFTFIDGHSMPEQNMWNLTDESSDSIETHESNRGYIYVMINSSYDGLVKIGKTTRDPDERAKELSSSTGVPTPFILVFYKSFIDCNSAEQQIHNFLEECGCHVNDNREFFKISTNKAIEVVQTFYEKEQSKLSITQSSNNDLSIFENNDEIIYDIDHEEPVFNPNDIFGKWKSSRLKIDDTWYDLSKAEFSQYGITVTFNHNFSFQDWSERFGSHEGTFKVFGRYINTFLADGEFITYQINSLSPYFADMTLLALDETMRFEFEKQN
jgi:hypothetical protein